MFATTAPQSLQSYVVYHCPMEIFFFFFLYTSLLLFLIYFALRVFGGSFFQP